MAKTAEIQVIIMRSGRTDWDDAGRLQGKTDLPLSQAGLQEMEVQVQGIASMVELTGIGSIHHSTDEASTQSAKLLAEAADAKLRTDDELAPLDLGVWEGLLDEQVSQRFPSAHRQWRADPALVTPPEGETFQHAAMRLRGSMRRALEKANGRPCVFILRPFAFGMAACWLAGKPTTELWHTLEDGPSLLRFSVDRSFVREEAEALRASASA